MTTHRSRARQWLAVTGVVTLVVAVILGVRWLGGSGEPSSADAGTGDRGPSGGDKADKGSALQAVSNKPSAPANLTKKPQQSQPQQRISMAGNGGVAAPASGSGGGVPKPPGNSTTQASPGAIAPTNESTNPTAPAAASGHLAMSPPSPAPSSDSAPTFPPGKPAAPSARPSAPRPAAASSAAAQQRIDLGLQLVKENKPVEARRVLTEALVAAGLAQEDAARLRNELTAINQRLVFSPEIVSSDPFVTGYQVQSGDALSKTPRKVGAQVDWRFIQRINKINDPARLQVGQRLKVVKGPFHAVVDKPAFRLDLYMGEGSDRVFVASFPVGLGEYGATPEGEFIVKPHSKLEDPAWTNPRTNEHFAANDPRNPLGEHWIGLVGVSDNIRGLEGYGLHGTIEPDSIGQERSMGCVRMGDDDIRLMFEVLMEGVSHIEIHGPDWP
jgi:lipoprotein-anchoring transpeptidase ErfK/SrfK